MQKLILIVCFALTFSLPLAAQNKRVWVLRAPGEAVEYDASTFAEKLVVKIPPEALASPKDLQIDALGQMLFAPAVALPLREGDFAGAKNVWFWNGHTATTLTRDISRTTATVGSNLAITESAPAPFLSADGAHLFWFSNQARRLQRDGVDLSNRLSWTELAYGPGRGEPGGNGVDYASRLFVQNWSLRRNLSLRRSLDSRRWSWEVFSADAVCSGTNASDL